MSLKVFHVIFIICSVGVTLGFSGWAVVSYRQTAEAVYLVTAAISFGVAIGLLFYGLNFLKKMKKIL